MSPSKSTDPRDAVIAEPADAVIDAIYLERGGFEEVSEREIMCPACLGKRHARTRAEHCKPGPLPRTVLTAEWEPFAIAEPNTHEWGGGG